MIQVIGIIEAMKRPTVPYRSCRLYRVADGQKSMIMMRTPLIAWNSTAATSPSSSRRTPQF